MNDTHSIWFDALQRVQTRVSPQNFDMWIRPLECVDVGAEIVKLRAPNAYIRLWFETNFLPEVVAELVSVAGRPISVEFASDAPEGAILRRSPACLLYTSPSPRDRTRSRMPSSA